MRVRCTSIACAFALIVMLATAASAAGARHVRLETDHGPVHVWWPVGYDAATAGIVVYVHGYFTDVDGAWRHHHLARQFAESGLNAVFIACEAPRNARDDVSWSNAADLLDAVAAQLPDPLPGGRLVVVGHSGAHRTISMWLEEDTIDTIVLVDALYGGNVRFRSWLDADPGHRLIDAADITRPWSDALHADIPDTLTFRRFPSRKAGRLEGARKARVVYVRSQHDHMSLVTDGVAIPMLLRALRIPVVEHASRTAPIHGT